MALLISGHASAQNDETEIIVTDNNGNEEEIDLPEAMTYELDSLLNLYNAKTYLRPADDCNMSDVNPVYDKEIYKERLNRLPTVIEMPYNDVVQMFIDRYTGRLRRSVSYMLGAQNFYMPIFEQALRKKSFLSRERLGLDYDKETPELNTRREEGQTLKSDVKGALKQKLQNLKDKLMKDVVKV